VVQYYQGVRFNQFTFGVIPSGQRETHQECFFIFCFIEIRTILAMYHLFWILDKRL
jgi:hypothetical protein